jgi:hypothetical protein
MSNIDKGLVMIGSVLIIGILGWSDLSNKNVAFIANMLLILNCLIVEWIK